MKIKNLLLLVVVAVAPLACTLGGSIDETGEPCLSDRDCLSDFECAPAESSNATRVCMPIPG